MKRLTIIRHGKAVPRGSEPDDRDRRLAERGREDARRMGEFFNEMSPDLIVRSPTERTRETAELFAEGTGSSIPIDVDELRIYRDGGSAPVEDLIEVVKEQRQDHIMLVGHNPAISDLVPELVAQRNFRDLEGVYLVTAAVAHIIFEELDEWANLEAKSGELRAWVTPRFAKKVM